MRHALVYSTPQQFNSTALWRGEYWGSQSGVVGVVRSVGVMFCRGVVRSGDKVCDVLQQLQYFACIDCSKAAQQCSSRAWWNELLSVHVWCSFSDVLYGG